jgi:hypothetical protein
MNVNHYIGFDVHKKTINYCVKMADGQIVEEGRLRATHEALRKWAGRRPEPWRGTMEATLFSGWIYDTLKPFAAGAHGIDNCPNDAAIRSIAGLL